MLLGVLIFLLGGIAFIFCLSALIKPMKFKLLSTRKRALIGMPIVLIVTFLGMGVAALTDKRVPQKSDFSNPSTPPIKQADKPVSIMGLSPSITSVKRDGETLVVNVYDQSAWDDAGLVNDAGVIAEDIGKAVQRGAPEAKDVTTVSLHLSTNLKDRLGKASKGEFMVLDFDADDFRNAEWSNLSIDNTLNLVKDVTVTPVGAKGSMAWCGNKGNSAPVFCMKAYGG